MDRTNRRDFLRMAALAAPSASALGRWSAWAAPTKAGAARATGAVVAWRTSGKSRCEKVDPPTWRMQGNSGSADIELQPSQLYQDVLGFGAALTDASCYLLEQMAAPARASLLRECFGADGLRLSMARTTIGSSDYSRNAYTYDDTPEPDPELTHFSIEHDRAYILPVLREVQQANPEMFYFSSPWSPPAWMKAGDSLLGGSMRKRYFAPYAEYFVRYIKGYAAEKVNIQAITVQNEIDTDQDGRMPQAMWGQEYEIGFISQFLGPAFAKNGIDTKIWILDHNYNLWGRVVDEFEDPELSKYVDGVAWHGYYGSPANMARVHDMFPRKHAYWTEGGPDYTAPTYATDWAKWSGTFSGILRNWSRSIVSWNLVLDENGKPNIGPFSCGGMLTLNSKTQQLSRSGQYWAFAHYSKFIARGARVFASNGSVAGIDHLAAQNPDGTRVLVLTNQGSEREVRCAEGDKSLALALPADSITTLTWS